MFFEWLDRIRQKPKVVREQYAVFAALVIVGIIVGVWSLSLPSRLSSLLDEETGVVQQASTPFSSLWSGMREQFSKRGDVLPADVPSVEQIPNMLEEMVRAIESGEQELPPPRPVANIVQITTTTTEAFATSSASE